MAISLVLAGVFFFSGFSSLAYQVVWQRVLTLYYGVGALSITLIVSIFMAGLGIGGALGGRLAERIRRPMAAYAAIELLIGLFGAASFQVLEHVGRATAGCALWLAFLYIGAFLLIPTVLMGMTLPLLTKIYSGLAGEFGPSVSRLYFINTLGAALGSLITAYGLITWGGLDTALRAAAGINGLLGLVILACGIGRFDLPSPPSREPVADRSAITNWRSIVFATGFLAIGYEIVWFRFHAVLLKESPYMFATVLAVYLTGIAFGSLAMAERRRGRLTAESGRRLFFGLQALIALYVFVSFLAFHHLSRIPPFRWLPANSFAESLHPLPGWPAGDSLPRLLRQWFVTLDIVFWPALFLLVPTLLMGASFPLAAVLSRHAKDDEARAVGRIYFWTIAGNVLGGLVTGFVLLPFAGTERTLLLFIAGGALFARPFVHQWSGKRIGWVGAAAALGLLLFPGRYRLYLGIHPNFGYGTAFIEEGREGVVVTYSKGVQLVNYINGLVHGGRPNHDFMQEALETLIHTPRAERVLVIGYGTGELCDTILKSSAVRELIVVELSHTLMTNLRKIPLIRNSLADGRLKIVMEDGRRYLIRETGSFDAILMDPLYHGTVYSNNLHSRQFFELAKARLNPRGVMMVWSSERRVTFRTVVEVFPHLRLYDHYVLASPSPMAKNTAQEEEILSRYPPDDRTEILRSRIYLGDERMVRSLSPAGTINEDWKPRCEYYLGLPSR